MPARDHLPLGIQERIVRAGHSCNAPQSSLARAGLARIRRRGLSPVRLLELRAYALNHRWGEGSDGLNTPLREPAPIPRTDRRVTIRKLIREEVKA